MGTESVYRRFRETAVHRQHGAFLNVLPETAAIYGIAAGEISYQAMLANVERRRADLARNGYGTGHRVGLLLQSRPVFLEIWFALNALGASVVPINPDLRQSELEYIVGSFADDRQVLDVVILLERRWHFRGVQCFVQRPGRIDREVLLAAANE